MLDRARITSALQVVGDQGIARFPITPEMLFPRLLLACRIALAPLHLAPTAWPLWGRGGCMRSCLLHRLLEELMPYMERGIHDAPLKHRRGASGQASKVSTLLPAAGA